jgi:hypothetical protein
LKPAAVNVAASSLRESIVSGCGVVWIIFSPPAGDCLGCVGTMIDDA